MALGKRRASGHVDKGPVNDETSALAHGRKPLILHRVGDGEVISLRCVLVYHTSSHDDWACRRPAEVSFNTQHECPGLEVAADLPPPNERRVAIRADAGSVHAVNSGLTQMCARI